MKKFDVQTYRDLVAQNSPVTADNLFVLVGKIQDTFGYVPAEVVRDLAARTGIGEARVYGALTSYKDFKLERQV